MCTVLVTSTVPGRDVVTEYVRMAMATNDRGAFGAGTVFSIGAPSGSVEVWDSDAGDGVGTSFGVAQLALQRSVQLTLQPLVQLTLQRSVQLTLQRSAQLALQWYESLLRSMSWSNQGEKTDDEADDRRVIRPQQMQIFIN